MRKIIILLCVGIMGFGLAACGKRGELLPPPGYDGPEKGK